MIWLRHESADTGKAGFINLSAALELGIAYDTKDTFTIWASCGSHVSYLRNVKLLDEANSLLSTIVMIICELEHLKKKKGDSAYYFLSLDDFLKVEIKK